MMFNANKKGILKNIFILTSIFSLILVFTIWSFFLDFKNKSEQYSKVNYELYVDKFNTEIKDKILLFDKSAIFKINKEMISNKYINKINIIQKRYLFDKDTLLFQTKSFNDSSWNITTVTVDVKHGEILKLSGNEYYEFIPSNTFNKNENIAIRYQLFKNGEIKNKVVFFNINLSQVLRNPSINEDKKLLIDSFLNLEDKITLNATKELTIDNIPFATIEYSRNTTLVKNEINSFLIKLLIYSLVVFFVMFLVVLFYQKYLKRKYLYRPLQYLDVVVLNLVNSKFKTINTNKFSYIEDYKKILTNLSNLTTHMASLHNELNINKETLERNLLTDNLTGLPDKKMFEIDMKSMFVYSGEGYLFSLKIGKLNEILDLNGSINTDNFILSYTNIINNIIMDTYRNKNIDLYRFYGSEFIIIARDITYDDALEFSNKIINNLLIRISKNYNLPNNIFHIGGTPFDAYGTIDSIMDSVEKAYKSAVLENTNGSVIIKDSLIKQDVLRLEKVVKSIIDESKFDIDFIFDSYSFDDKLVLRELKPILKDEADNVIPIGSFIAISEKIDLHVEFDTKVILKAIEFIEKNSIDYKLAINLSIKTISNTKFINFLTNLVKEKENILNHILFSITSYAASAYKVEFTQFVTEMNKLKIEILMKRFRVKEFPLDELASIKIDYIKIDRDLSQNVHNDLIKKHGVKNIVIFGELNNINILAENVELDNDYLYLSKLDLFAINR